MDALWMAEGRAADDDGLHHDLAEARHFLKEYRALGIPCELVWLKVGQCEEGEGIGWFLGYDVGWMGYSVIADTLIPSFHETVCPPHNDTERAEYVLFELAYRYFRLLLNEHLLFSDYETAEFCRQVAHAFQVLVPSLVEQDGYKVIGIFEVDPWEQNEANRAVEAAFMARLQEEKRRSGGMDARSEG